MPIADPGVALAASLAPGTLAGRVPPRFNN